VTSGQDVPGTRSSGTAGGGGAGGPPRRRRWLVLVAVAAVVVIVVAALGSVYAARRRSAAALRATTGPDTWTVTRRSRFRLQCLDEARAPLPLEVAGKAEATDRYCTCLAEQLAAAFPSFSRATKALAQDAQRGVDPDGRQAAEIVRRCVASSR
jgi:hypothetical protein